MTSPAILEAACHELRRAVRVEGPAPHYHRSIESRSRAEWPPLWDAIDKVLHVLDEMERERVQDVTGPSAP